MMLLRTSKYENFHSYIIDIEIKHLDADLIFELVCRYYVWFN